MNTYSGPSRLLVVLFLVVDVGFISYWMISALGVLPATWMFKDYDSPILHAWNWSFLPLDLSVSFTGFMTLRLARSGKHWRSWAVMSLTLTSCAGLQAVAFWALRRDFDPVWWIPNLFLLLYPLVFLPGLLQPGATPEKNEDLPSSTAP